eukprot:RCo023518
MWTMRWLLALACVASWPTVLLLGVLLWNQLAPSATPVPAPPVVSHHPKNSERVSHPSTPRWDRGSSRPATGAGGKDLLPRKPLGPAVGERAGSRWFWELGPW